MKSSLKAISQSRYWSVALTETSWPKVDEKHKNSIQNNRKDKSIDYEKPQKDLKET